MGLAIGLVSGVGCVGVCFSGICVCLINCSCLVVLDCVYCWFAYCFAFVACAFAVCVIVLLFLCFCYYAVFVLFC